ncbi:MAG: GTPase ObgE [Ilumatobacteraceae bacterium]
MSGFVDEAQLNVRGGDGGAGCVSFRREGPEVYGGPNGGDGGDGGAVWLVADHNVASLVAFRDHPHRRGEDGVSGMGKDLHGRRGKDLEVSVPEGTIVRDLYTGEVLADLQRHGMRFRAVAGGQGGRGNARFLSNRRRAPKFAEQGEHGPQRWLKLELKLMADVALVGYPNAGKSTFISTVSAAKPKIANYPFTTLEPHLGVVRMGPDTEFVIADIPGLIEGASQGKGLGHQFLRHIERARVLCLLIDLASMEEIDPHVQVDVLLRELGEYRPDLLDRPRVIVGTKGDAVSEETRSRWTYPIISAVTGAGVKDVLGALAEIVRDARRETIAESTEITIRPEPDGVTVERIGDNEYRLHGRAVERAVALNDVTSVDALNYIDDRLSGLGVPRLLARAGARDGAVIHIKEFSFEFIPEVRA